MPATNVRHHGCADSILSIPAPHYRERVLGGTSISAHNSKPDFVQSQNTRRLAIDPAMLPVATEMEIETAVTAIMQKPGGSLIVMPDSFMIAHRETILGLAAKHKVPVIYPFAPFALKGGLMAYGVNMAVLTRRAAGYVDRVLKGEKAASLPVQLPAKFELVVNIKAAKAIGLDIPLTVLVQATEVIE